MGAWPVKQPTSYYLTILRSLRLSVSLLRRAQYSTGFNAPTSSFDFVPDV